MNHVQSIDVQAGQIDDLEIKKELLVRNEKYSHMIYKCSNLENINKDVDTDYFKHPQYNYLV